ncbi:MGDG synthase family glycosyltransferase [Aggregatilinea lenta]|uniref:MGDG synthase family glycosyltransferase n=1 Tax=Aggregatilinea lenta TaxID=913108 RepID=UPI000E5ABDA1|nr:glycosyltransferase [Aggregatilinea lenta]
MKRIVFLMSDTGGGHRAAADAIRAALDQRHPGEYTYALVDVYRRYTPFPFNRMPEIYPRWVQYAAATWGWSYAFANARVRDRLVMGAIKRLWGQGMQRLVADHPADVVVGVHSVLVRPALWAFNRMQPYRPPFVTVITDLVSTHAFWYDRDVDRCLAPTQAAYRRGQAFGLRPDQLRITGLPVHPAFVEGLLGKAEARRKLGWDARRPAVLLVGGGDGMGPVYATARALNQRRLDMQLVIIAGRNGTLRQQLEAVRWNQPTTILPFVNNMPELMAAADVLVTKAGPATICEACIAGLPVVLSGYVPGQEDGNVTYVVENGAGVYAPTARGVAQTVAAWLAEGPDGLARRSEAARALARPQAAWDIAEEIHAQTLKAAIRTRLPGAYDHAAPRLRPTPEDGWVI